ncbi:peptidylprolyl isomerase, partial [Campylobacter jejuni]|uniref:peptidylprolyl isomerase n=1 Tax=Campylobacter jejuni TaxID=197 RepID=UPI001F0936D9
AMARTSDPHSATAQFFINTADNQFLDYPGQDGWGYCVFGEVIDGKEIVDRIKSVKTTRVGMHQDVPA